MTCMPPIHELCIRPLYAALSQYVDAKLAAAVATPPMSMCPSTALSSLCKQALLCDASLWYHHTYPSGFLYNAPSPLPGGKDVSPAASSRVLTPSLQPSSMQRLLLLRGWTGMLCTPQACCHEQTRSPCALLMHTPDTTAAPGRRRVASCSPSTSGPGASCVPSPRPQTHLTDPTETPLPPRNPAATENPWCGLTGPC
jgi:hypothetical protein